jgi:hypothetical protein
MYTITSLYQLRQRLGLAASDTTDDPRLLAALQSAAAHLERLAGRRFCPRIAALRHDFTNSAELLLDDDLLELTTLTNGDGSMIPTQNVLRLPEYGPAGVLRLTGGSAFTWTQTPVQAISLAGIWGWHDRWSAAWRESADAVQNNPLSAGATSITVNDADGADGEGETPRFQVGHLIRIESEYLRVLAVNTTGNLLTVQRGVNGSTAASHTQNTAIQVYQPPADIAALALRWAAWLYREADMQTAAPSRELDEAIDALRRASVKA